VTGALPRSRAARRPASRAALLPLRDATLASGALIGAIFVGSGGFAELDPALFGYLGATLVAAFAVTWRASAFWRRPASAFYARALYEALRDPRGLRRSLAAAGRDLAAQDFVRRRGAARWAAHMALSLGTMASFAITLPLVFGWMRFSAEGAHRYRLHLATLPTFAFDTDGAIGWVFFHALALAGVAVAAGAAYFVAVRWRARRLPGATAGFALAPLLLLLLVALTGLALPATRGNQLLFDLASRLHEVSVVVLLGALPFSKLSHVLIRPLQLGARAVRHAASAWSSCTGCGAPLAPAAQQRAVAELLAARGIAVRDRLETCPACRRKGLGATQAGLVGAGLQPAAISARPLPAKTPGPVAEAA
jgi:hypothetical protein